MSRVIQYIFAIPIALAISAYFSWACGYVASKLWGWHLADRLGFSVSWREAMCVFMIVTLARLRIRTWKDDRSDSEKMVAEFGRLITPWVLLLIGWWLR